jgi:chitinase
MACTIPGYPGRSAGGAGAAMNARPPVTNSPERKCLLLTILCCAVVTGAFAQTIQRDVIGYLPSWKRAVGGKTLHAVDLPLERLTCVNYAFYVPLPDGTIGPKDAVGDSVFLSKDPASGLIPLAHSHGVDVVLSIGGWDDSDLFPALASTPETRALFAHSCCDAIRTYGFDGIDIDWEYPGYPDHKGTPADTRNFTSLLSALRDSLDALGIGRGKRYGLTAALPAGGENLGRIAVADIARILDRLNIMTYDYYGYWDPSANHNSPLFPAAGSDMSRCIDASFKWFHDHLGVPSSRLNIGVPFYGKTYAGCVGPNSGHSGPDTLFSAHGGAGYTQICELAGQFKRLWDTTAQVPYLVDPARQVFVTYEDETSVRAKAAYVLEHDIRGVIIWEITDDLLPDGTTPLLNALAGSLRAPRPALH